MYLVADIGGTKTRIAASHDLEEMTEPVIFDTPKEYAAGIERLKKEMQQLAGDEPIEAVSLGAPGVIWKEGSVVIKSNLPNWDGKPIVADIHGALGAQVYLHNDTALNGLGEAARGAGAGASIVVYVTVSTGVNGVRIVDGKIDRAAIGFEVGRQFLAYQDPLTRLTDLIAGGAVARKYGMHPRELGRESPVWEELARYTAIGLHNTILHWSPERVVLGGSMFNEIGISVERVRFHLEAIMTAFPEIPEIVHSTLGDTSGLWGGIAFLKQAKR